MSAKSLRPENKPLAYLIEHFPETPELTLAVSTLHFTPLLLLYLSGYTAKECFNSCNMGTEDSVIMYAVTCSLFDCALTVFFDEMDLLLKEHEIASLLTDAALFEATGCDVGIPSEIDVINGQTSGCHGIAKYSLLNNNVPDNAGWLLAKEVTTILLGSNPIGIHMVICSISVQFRIYAKQMIRHALYGGPKDENLTRIEDEIEEDLKRRANDAMKKAMEALNLPPSALAPISPTPSIKGPSCKCKIICPNCGKEWALTMQDDEKAQYVCRYCGTIIYREPTTNEGSGTEFPEAR